MSEEKVNFARSSEDLSDLLGLVGIELWVQVETAELGDEELEICSGVTCIFPRERRIEADTHK